MADEFAPQADPQEAGAPEMPAGDATANDGTIILASQALPQELLLVPAFNKPVFPGMLFPMLLEPGEYAATLSEAAQQDHDKVVGFVLVRDEEESTEDPQSILRRMYRVGTACRLQNFQEAPDGSVRALLQGVRRFELLRVGHRGDRIVGQVIYLDDQPADAADERIKALSLAIMNTMRELVKNNPMFSEEIRMFLSRGNWDDAGRLADFAVTITNAEGEVLQDVLACTDAAERLEKALFILRQELNLNQLKERITHQIEEKVSKQQREFFLHEQLKAIKQELGLEKDEKTSEVEEFRERLQKLTLPQDVQKVVDQELNKLGLLSAQSPEYTVVRNYLDWLTSLPWGVTTEDHLDVPAARKILDRDHYGLEDVKERILEFIAVSKLRGSVEGSILCLIGPPGVGKTSLGRCVAEALGRKFFRFSLGGMRDEAEIKGHRRTYIGAMPGKLIQTLRNTGTQNPVIMLDEIDKVGASFHGDPASALLEVLDPEQNHAFLDHYLDVPFDLSQVLFIATANVPDTIPPALFDRMEVIRLSGYIMDEKLAIAKRHLVPRLRETSGLTGSDVRFTDGGIKRLIRGYAREAGVRALEKALRGCLRKVAARKAEAGEAFEPVSVKNDTVEDLLGRPTFPDDTLLRGSHPGVVTGLAWTPLGGNVLHIEAMAIPGKGSFKQTGQLGDVMQESASIAYSYLHGRAAAYGIGEKFFDEHAVHLHVPAGATPKDGPSAGVTMAVALLSMATDTKLPLRVAMTGELTLTGHVLPVGGIKEKVIAAKRVGIKDVILPGQNRKDFDEIPEHVRRGLRPHFVDDWRDVHRLLFKGGLETMRADKERDESEDES